MLPIGNSTYPYTAKVIEALSIGISLDSSGKFDVKIVDNTRVTSGNAKVSLAYSPAIMSVPTSPQLLEDYGIKSLGDCRVQIMYRLFPPLIPGDVSLVLEKKGGKQRTKTR